jgi:SET domain-containing protein
MKSAAGTRKSRKTPVHHAHMRHTDKSVARPASEPPYVVRRSRIHGRGVYATRRIRKGTRIVEYVGERISHEEADERYAYKGLDDGHTFLFVVDDRMVIDAGVDGNEARFINHSCDPNCEPVTEGRRIYIEALRTIEPGEELGYLYGLTWTSTDPPEELANYACRCGAANCRGTMLDEKPTDAKPARKRRKRKAGGSSATGKAAGRSTRTASGRSRRR